VPVAEAPAQFAYEDVVAFCGRRHSFYWRAWQKHGDSLYCGFNGPAFLFNFVWFAYRKMYREALVLVGIVIALGVGGELLLGASPEASQSVDKLMRVVVGVSTSLLANGLYRRRAKAAIARAHATHPNSPEARRELLVKLGGTNLLATLLAVAVMVGFVVLAVVAKD